MLANKNRDKSAQGSFASRHKCDPSVIAQLTCPLKRKVPSGLMVAKIIIRKLIVEYECMYMSECSATGSLTLSAIIQRQLRSLRTNSRLSVLN